MASAHQKKAGRAFKAARSSCIRSESTVTGFDRCMSKELKSALGGSKRKRKTTKKRRRR